MPMVTENGQTYRRYEEQTELFHRQCDVSVADEDYPLTSKHLDSSFLNLTKCHNKLND